MIIKSAYRMKAAKHNLWILTLVFLSGHLGTWADSATEGPYIAYLNGSAITSTNCCNKYITTIVESEEPMSFRCGIGPLFLNPYVHWNQDVYSKEDPEERKSIVKNSVTVSSLSKVINVQRHIGLHEDVQLTCTVHATDSSGKTLLNKTMCLTLRTKSRLNGSAAWIGLQLMFVVAIIAMVFCPYMGYRPKRERPVLFDWIKLSLGTCAISCIIGVVWIECPRTMMEQLIIKRRFSGPHSSGSWTMVMHPLQPCIAVCVLVGRVITDALALRLLVLWRPGANPLTKYGSRRCLGGPFFITGILFGPGLLYLLMMLACLTENFRRDKKPNGARYSAGATSFKTAFGLLGGDLSATSIATCIFIWYNVSSVVRRINKQEDAMVYLEGSWAASITIYAYMALCFLVCSACFFWKAFTLKYDQDKNGKLTDNEDAEL